MTVRKEKIRGAFKLKHKSEHKKLISFRIRPSDLKALDEIWKDRCYPNPWDRNKPPILFTSRNEYLEFCIMCLNLAGKRSWRWFSHFLDPNYSED